MNHSKSLLHLQFPLANGGYLWTKDEIVQDTEYRILQLMQKAEGERRARFCAQKAATASKQLAADTCLHTTAFPVAKAKVTSSILCDAMEDSENSRDSVGGDVFEESVMPKSASCVRSNRKPNAGLKLTTGRRLLVPLLPA